MSHTRPNILFIQCDQLNPLFTGVYGHPVVKTPNLDRLARQGILYERAYSPCPVCAPARMSNGQKRCELELPAVRLNAVKDRVSKRANTTN